jgi:REP element-mobilizing transposase RayT
MGGNEMTYDPQRHHRRSIRLKGYDYTQPGAYFVTICTRNRECLFGGIVDGKMRLNPLGDIVAACWHDLPNHYPHVQLDAFVIMPNHVHGIIVLLDPGDVGAGLGPAPTTGGVPTSHPKTHRGHGLPEIVRAFKSFSARRINEYRRTPGTPVWQRNYYEHIIRNERSLGRIREYIVNNPLQWELDRENPAITALGLKITPPKDEPWRG